MDLLDFCITPLREFLPDLTYDEVCRRAQRMTFRDGQALHARGDDVVRLCMVQEGAVRFGRFRQEGMFNMLAMIGPGAHFGDIAQQRSTRTNNAYAIGDTVVGFIEASIFEDLLKNVPSFTEGLRQANTARLSALLELYDDARSLGVTVRLGKLVYIHAGRGELADGVACLQRDLAELLGVSLVSIGTALKELEKEGLVETGYRCVRVPDKARLKAWLLKSGAV